MRGTKMSREERIRVDRIKAERKSAVRLLAVILIGVFVLVGMRSYAAIIQHENNLLVEQNEYLQAEIDSLSSEIIEETKVTRIEEVATQKYGMVYPTADNCVNLGAEEDKTHDLASVIRSEAYN